MPVRRRAFSIDHPIVITFLIFAVIAFLALAAEVLKPLALAILLSFMLAPLAGFLERRGLPRPPAVALTLVLALGVLGAVTYQVGRQLTMLAYDLPKYEDNIMEKLNGLKPSRKTAVDRLTEVSSDLAQTLDPSSEMKGVQRVTIVSLPTFTERLQAAVGPYLERLGVASLVLILVLSILCNRDDLSDRIIRLFGQGRVSLTTRTMDEVGERISRYLGMFALVNSCFGVVVGLGLWAIGVPYPLLWGALFACLRFIPYVGPAAAFVLPFTVSVACSHGWREPVLVIVLFGTLEALANAVLEPVVYGRATGVSALGLLVAAMFWTWLWGSLGLLLSTPLTVCLAVLGKYVPGLGVFATLLGEESVLTPDVRFYQRLLLDDQDGALALVDAALKEQPREEVFDQILIPALSHAGRDRARDFIDEDERAVVWRFVGGWLDDLEAIPLDDPRTAADESLHLGEPLQVLAIASNDRADELVLRMLGQLLPGDSCHLAIHPSPESLLNLAQEVADAHPDLIFISHLPPAGFTNTRYLVRRLRARFDGLPIVAGWWRDNGDSAEAAERLKSVGATSVVFSVAEARDSILEKARARADVESELAAAASS